MEKRLFILMSALFLCLTGCEPEIGSADLFAVKMTVNLGSRFSEDITVISDKGQIIEKASDSAKSSISFTLADPDSTTSGRPNAVHEYRISITGSKIDGEIVMNVVTDDHWSTVDKIYDGSVLYRSSGNVLLRKCETEYRSDIVPVERQTGFL